MDPEKKTSEEIAQEAEQLHLASLASREEWAVAKKYLVAQINSATSILDMPALERRDINLIEARYHAAQIVAKWMEEVDGMRSLHDKLDEDNDPNEERGVVGV